MTFLQLINKILVRLRECEVTAWDENEYSKLIAELVNETKREVEDSWQWGVLQSDLAVAANPASADTWAMGMGERDRLYRDERSCPIIWDITNDVRLRQASLSMLKRWENIGTAQTTDSPSYYTIQGDNITLWPYLTNTVNLEVTTVAPQAELAADATVLTIPWYPIVLGAYARAIYERGENQGDEFSIAQGAYMQAWNDAVTLDQSRNGPELCAIAV